MVKARVLLDTNALLIPFQFGINIESELDRLLGSYEILVPSSVSREIAGLASDRYTKAAVRLCAKYRAVDCISAPTVDDGILSLARKTRAIVVTCDRNLQRRLLSAGLKVVAMRGKNHLVLLPANKT
jgi:rRNA-processing protein FCF1